MSSSSQEEGLEQIAARLIQKTWRRYVNREVFKYFNDLINQCNQQDPRTILKTVNPREAELLDAAAGVFIRFRLGGVRAKNRGKSAQQLPDIYYKIFTHRPIADVCANSPKDYTQEGLKRPVAQQTNNGWPLTREDRSGWYQRMENNNWRLFCSKVVHVSEPVEIGANKKMDFHHSRLQRKQDVEKWRKRRRIEWLKQLYNQGHLQTHPEHPLMATIVENSAQGVKDAFKEKRDDEILEWELDNLLAWTSALSFEDYMEDWRRLACSHSSELNVLSHQPRVDPRELAAVADEDS